MYSLTDLNGDGVADLMVHSLEGSISSKHSTYEVHFGARAPDGGTVFARGVDIAFQSDGSIQLGMDRHDFDRDGQVLMFTTIEVEYLTSSLWKRWKGFWGDDIWLNLEFYRMEGGLYPDTPNAIRRMQLDGTPSPREPGWVPLDIVLRGGTHASRTTQEVWPRAFNGTLLIGDVTGDGRSDLLIGDHPQILVKIGFSEPQRGLWNLCQLEFDMKLEDERRSRAPNSDLVLVVKLGVPTAPVSADGLPVDSRSAHAAAIGEAKLPLSEVDQEVLARHVIDLQDRLD